MYYFKTNCERIEGPIDLYSSPKYSIYVENDRIIVNPIKLGFTYEYSYKDDNWHKVSKYTKLDICVGKSAAPVIEKDLGYIKNIKFCSLLRPENGDDYDDVEELEIYKDDLRYAREKECYAIINRGSLWYDMLSIEQRAELSEWYELWLDVTETFCKPTKPVWLSEKLIKTEEIL